MRSPTPVTQSSPWRCRPTRSPCTASTARDSQLPCSPTSDSITSTSTNTQGFLSAVTAGGNQNSTNGVNTAGLGVINGADVSLQQALNQYLGQSVAVDGVFASSTADAVRQYQTNKGLTVDGAVGPVTWGQIRFDSCGG